jgi:murein DD-endopeptidase MepM/ murein hydrolase activator NlpD
MPYLIRFCFFVAFLFASLIIQAQPPKQEKEFGSIKAPTIEYNVPDLEDPLFEEDFADSVQSLGYAFDPEQAASLVAEDTSDYDEEGDGEGESLVIVADQIRIDSSWITIAEYYSIWDSRNINPYQIDPATFKDTIRILLYDSLQGQYWSMPLMTGIINSKFGWRKYRFHYGTDLDLTIGDPVFACFDGIVRISRYNANGYGNYIVIRHYNGLETLYGHLSKSNVQVGDYVKAGDIIGLGGNTGRSSGPHLHFEVRYAGNAFDPQAMFLFEEKKLVATTFELKPEHYSYASKARQIYYHSVRSGDTLSRIAKKYGVSVTQICRLNGISTRTPLRIGRRLRIR